MIGSHWMALWNHLEPVRPERCDNVLTCFDTGQVQFGVQIPWRACRCNSAGKLAAKRSGSNPSSEPVNSLEIEIPNHTQSYLLQIVSGFLRPRRTWNSETWDLMRESAWRDSERWKCLFLVCSWSDLFGYGSIPIDTFLVGWTSIYQLFWCSPGVPGFWPIPI